MLTCQRQDLRKLRFEVDSKQLVTSLNLGSSVAEIHSVVSDILNLSAEFESVSFVWISREKNLMADSLPNLLCL